MKKKGRNGNSGSGINRTKIKERLMEGRNWKKHLKTLKKTKEKRIQKKRSIEKSKENKRMKE